MILFALAIDVVVLEGESKTIHVPFRPIEHSYIPELDVEAQIGTNGAITIRGLAVSSGSFAVRGVETEEVVRYRVTAQPWPMPDVWAEIERARGLRADAYLDVGEPVSYAVGFPIASVESSDPAVVNGRLIGGTLFLEGLAPGYATVIAWNADRTRHAAVRAVSMSNRASPYVEPQEVVILNGCSVRTPLRFTVRSIESSAADRAVVMSSAGSLVMTGQRCGATDVTIVEDSFSFPRTMRFDVRVVDPDLARYRGPRPSCAKPCTISSSIPCVAELYEARRNADENPSKQALAELEAAAIACRDRAHRLLVEAEALLPTGDRGASRDFAQAARSVVELLASSERLHSTKRKLDDCHAPCGSAYPRERYAAEGESLTLPVSGGFVCSNTDPTVASVRSKRNRLVIEALRRGRTTITVSEGSKSNALLLIVTSPEVARLRRRLEAIEAVLARFPKDVPLTLPDDSSRSPR